MDIKWTVINSKTYLKFTFEGRLEEQEALRGIEIWKREFEKHKYSKTSMIWDCSLMHGYAPKARIHWQNALNELKSQIGAIWLISNSLVIRTGASILSRFVGLKINAIDSEDKIKD